MTPKKAPPEWEVQVTREINERLEIETLGPFSISRAKQTARRLLADRDPAEFCVEVYPASYQERSLRW